MTAGAGAAAVTGMGIAGCSNEQDLAEGHIQHGVIFSLTYPADSAVASKFLEDGRRILTAIPVVREFQVFRQVSQKNEYDFGFTMVFGSKEDYTTYNEHPDHKDFVENRWMKEVEKFLEIDFETVPVPK